MKVILTKIFNKIPKMFLILLQFYYYVVSQYSWKVVELMLSVLHYTFYCLPTCFSTLVKIWIKKLIIKKQRNTWHETGDMRHVTGDRWYETGNMRQVTWDRWHETHDMRHVTWDTWHETHDMRHVTWDAWHETRDMRHMT